jgi:hypothetical protein
LAGGEAIIVMDCVTGEAHCPALGVNVYVFEVLGVYAGVQTPEIPLLEIVGRGEAIPGHWLGAMVKTGRFELLMTVTVKVVVVAHCPALGVKVYVVVAVLLGAGDHVPVIPLVEVVGSVGNVVLIQIGLIAVKVGVTKGVIVILSVVGFAHCPALGVKVYVVVALGLNAGFHVPEMPLVEVAGSGLTAVPIQYGPKTGKVGVIRGFIVMVTVVVVAH